MIAEAVEPLWIVLNHSVSSLLVFVDAKGTPMSAL